MKDKLYKLMDWPSIEAICFGEENHPERLLKPSVYSGNTLFQAAIPFAEKVSVKISEGIFPMEKVDEEGFFAALLPGKIKEEACFLYTDAEGREGVLANPYQYSCAMKKEEKSNWNRGIMYNAYDHLGARLKTISKTKGVLFRVWAPEAIRVSVVGSFNNWNGIVYPMIKDEDTGIFSLFVPGLSADCEYKYEVAIKGGCVTSRIDPYNISSGKGTSIVAPDGGKSFRWKDKGYLEGKICRDYRQEPVAVMEADLFKLLGGGDKEDEGGHSLDIKALKALIDRCLELKIDFVKLLSASEDIMKVLEFADMADLKIIVNSFHEAGIGIIYNFPASSFSTNPEGLVCYDGTYLYGHMDERKRFNSITGGCCYNYGRPQVVNYLLSSACFLMNEFHFDGLYMDNLSSMLFLDFGRYEGEWTPNMYGGTENLEAIDFVKHFNSIIHRFFPYCVTIARETCAFPKVTGDLNDGGLGFDFLLNVGFAEDYNSFIKEMRTGVYLHRITDSFSYEYSENYLCGITKDDVIAANEYKSSLVDGGRGYFNYAPIDDEHKSMAARLTLAFIYARPGKKLIFEGELTDCCAPVLGGFYKELKAFYRLDRDPYGIEWTSGFDHGDGCMAFMRKDEYLDHSILAVFNFSMTDYEEYKFGISHEGKYTLIFNSREKQYGGDMEIDKTTVKTTEEFYDGRANSLVLSLPALSAAYYEYTPYTEEELLKIAEEKVNSFKQRVQKEAREKAKAIAKKTYK